MMVEIAKWILILFGIFLAYVGFLMLFNPSKARHYLRLAASTNLINYIEITVRMIPAAALVIYSDYSRFPDVFWVMGSFMILTSLVLYVIPRRMHHNYALKCAEILKPVYLRALSPLSFAMCILVIYAVV